MEDLDIWPEYICAGLEDDNMSDAWGDTDFSEMPTIPGDDDKMFLDKDDGSGVPNKTAVNLAAGEYRGRIMDKTGADMHFYNMKDGVIHEYTNTQAIVLEDNPTPTIVEALGSAVPAQVPFPTAVIPTVSELYQPLNDVSFLINDIVYDHNPIPSPSSNASSASAATNPLASKRKYRCPKENRDKIKAASKTRMKSKKRGNTSGATRNDEPTLFMWAVMQLLQMVGASEVQGVSQSTENLERGVGKRGSMISIPKSFTFDCKAAWERAIWALTDRRLVYCREKHMKPSDSKNVGKFYVEATGMYNFPEDRSAELKKELRTKVKENIKHRLVDTTKEAKVFRHLFPSEEKTSSQTLQFSFTPLRQ